MKQIPSLITVIFCAVTLQAQQIRPQAVTTSGATLKNGNSEVTFTVGEITVKTITDGNFSIGQGIISGSSAVNITTKTIDPISAGLDIRFFPNPVQTLLIAEVQDTKNRFLEWTIYDISGKVISSDIYAAQTNRVNFNTANWQVGTYIMTVSERGGQILGSYQVIKQ
jgi:hypothetical protein